MTIQGSGSREFPVSSAARYSYDIFLSFRRIDAENDFINHLYTALSRAGFHTFRYDDGTDRGEDLLKKLIVGSEVSILILSKNFASSKWCLFELALIMERRRTNRQHVIPIFYYTNPSHVMREDGDYALAIARHETESKTEMGNLKMWRKALQEVADLGGIVLQKGSEAAVVEDVVKEIRNKLDKKELHDGQI